jgi:hypothetical protein
MSRRGFIAACAAIGVGCLPGSRHASAGAAIVVPSLEHLREALDTQGGLHGYPLSAENCDNLGYAYSVIVPQTHTEAALVVWAGSQYESVVQLIDEYVRRRSGQASRLFDHPVLALSDMCQPETRRILVFREQLKALCRELTTRDVAERICRGDEERNCSLEMFSEYLRPLYKKSLLAGEVEVLHRYIREMYATSREFSWCATVVDRGLQTA